MKLKNIFAKVTMIMLVITFAISVFDLSQYAGTYVTLRFCIYDAGDSIYDSIALIDEVKVA